MRLATNVTLNTRQNSWQSQQPLKLTSIKLTAAFHLCLVLRLPQQPGFNAEKN